jgi:Sec-independent protein translocase protein TatA
VPPPQTFSLAAREKRQGYPFLPIYAADRMPYLRRMPGLSTSELAIVVFILLLVIVAGRLPRWGEALGSYFYRRGSSVQPDERTAASKDDASTRTPGSGPSSQVPPLS